MTVLTKTVVQMTVVRVKAAIKAVEVAVGIAATVIPTRALRKAPVVHVKAVLEMRTVDRTNHNASGIKALSK
jgi:hypothetical protein